jgi:putative copper resistance protein D
MVSEVAAAAAVMLLQLGSAIVVNTSLAWMAGVWLARLWLRGSEQTSASHRALNQLLATSMLSAALLCLLGSGAGLWAATAVMSGAALGPATGMLVLVATDTALGHSSLLGMTMLLAIAGIGLVVHLESKAKPACDLAIAALLLGFAFTRASNSHAAENGLLSLGFAVEALHLILVAAWVGAVAVAAWVVLPSAQRTPVTNSNDFSTVTPGYLAADLTAHLTGYLISLSRAAALALAGIVTSGLYNGWYRLGALENLLGNPYGNVLSVKVTLVLLAVALGGYNKWIGFPSIVNATSRSTAGLARVIAILRLESALLLAALSAAALLVSLPPPASF